MSTRVAPWLQGLDEAWEVPAGVPISSNVSSASHDANSLRSNGSRLPRRSLSGLPSSLRSQNTSSNATTQLKRSPLAPLSNSNTNTFRRPMGTIKRSVSDTSDGSLLHCAGTVQQRSKSASPAKKHETLEWKKRLLNGHVSYGDQTDLFGPSGLENIFAKSSGQENANPKKSRMGWLQKGDSTMPSSPPPWPNSFVDDEQREGADEERLEQVEEEQPDGEYSYEDEHDGGSFRSNPFDLQSAQQERSDPQSEASEVCKGAGNRTVSGETDVQSKEFSPVFISKHTTINGQVTYTALDSHTIKQFNSVKVSLRHPSEVQPQPESDELEEPEEKGIEQSAFTDGPESDSLPAGPDFSLSENLPTGTPPVAGLSHNVEYKRGGYSAYGSFKQRPLSPSPSKPSESIMPEPSDLLSPSMAGRPLPPAPTPPPMMTTPLRPTTPSPVKSRSSGSPLKLFGPHDTFTNNRLLRRLSQLEPEAPLAEESEVRDEPIEVQYVMRQSNIRHISHASSRQSFGSGQLDTHAFNAEITITSASDSNKDDSDRSPGSEIPPPGGRDPVRFRVEISPEVVDTFKLKRKLSRQSAARSSKHSTLDAGQQKPATAPQPTVEDVSELDAYFQRADQLKSFEGVSKRPPTSPFKNPTPKRRRTLHASELEDVRVEVSEANLSYHQQMQEAVSSRKRRDARPGESQITADPDTLASRKILRPRNPTPSQQWSRKQQIRAELREAAEEFAAQVAQEQGGLEAVMEQIESSMAGSEGPSTQQQQAEVLASHVANFTLKVHRPSGEHAEGGQRKRSITTQDFMNEAIMVMQLIRAKARPASGLGSVEESDAEASSNGLMPGESMAGSEEVLRVSRPPSREGMGHSGWRSAMRPQTDARVVSHLRRFQERDDTEFIAESIASLHMDDEESLNDNVIVVDEASNIRITGPPPEVKQRAAEAFDESRPQTQGSQESAATSTGRTIGTSSTRKSENVGTLAPEAVAHLIDGQVGGMTFDKSQQRWVRVKSPEKKHRSKEFLEPPSTLTSDDDPFREISDLPVDEQTELRRISASSKTVKPSLSGESTVSAHDQQPAEERVASAETVVTRPVTRDSSHMQSRIHHAHSSSVPSRYTAFASSQQQDKVETRATSYSDEEMRHMAAMGKARREPSMAYAAAQATLALRAQRDSVAEEEPVADATELTFPSPPTHQMPEEVNGIPEESIMPASPTPQAIRIEDRLRDDTVVDDEQPAPKPLASVKMRQSPAKGPPPAWDVPRQMSLRRKTLTKGWNGDAREQSEISLVAALPGERMMSLSLSVSRPLATRQQSIRVAELQSSPTKAGLNSTFMLSDLPEFTIHEEDKERPSERVLAKRLAKHAADEVNDRYALAVKDLVKTMTDVQGDELYWEDVKQLDLHDRSLSSLYGLDDFCSRVQEMDVSDNQLTHLQGAPSSTRRLYAMSNQLTSLTCWNHLMNLQSVNVSDNQLDSLAGLGRLIHLRDIRADDNQIANLDGLQELDGLLNIRLRRNRIQHVDFEGFQLQRLEELDLGENRICAVERLERLESLRSLRLDGNLLQHGLTISQRMPSLEELSLRNCGLHSLRVDMLPRLRFLDVDDNSLADIEGISTIKSLECLSLRRQSLAEGTQLGIFAHTLEARVVRLSGNVIPFIPLSHSFLNLKHLELASVGLQELPDDFGLRMPNLRTLNLNFNALKDIRPLLNIQKLEQLSLCGNRLDRLRKSVATLAKLTSLQSVDMRQNPVTQGFYAPAITAQTSVVRRHRPQVAEDEDGNAELLELAKHDLPRGDAEQDRQHQARIDEETRLRRRVYELLLAHSCPALEDLDGLQFAKDAAVKRDQVWERLVELGVVRKSHGTAPGLLHERAAH